MKSILSKLALVFLSLFVISGTAIGEPVKLELKGSPEFVSEAPLEKIVGMSEGLLTLTGDFTDLKALQAVVVIPVASMRTGNEIRDEHLRGEGWLNAAANPNVELTQHLG